jgi:hypothetical protein
MFGISSTIFVALTFVPLSQQIHPLNNVARPKLIAKAKAYYLHALLPATEGRLPWVFERQLESAPSCFEINGVVLLHTATATGEMKVLAAGGTIVVNPLVAFEHAAQGYLPSPHPGCGRGPGADLRSALAKLFR